MEATTVEIIGFADKTIFLNCGTVTEYEGSTAIKIDGHIIAFDQILHDPVGAAQRFADLLTDVTE